MIYVVKGHMLAGTTMLLLKVEEDNDIISIILQTSTVTFQRLMLVDPIFTDVFGMKLLY